MDFSAAAKQPISGYSNGTAKLGDIKKRGNEINKDHSLVLEL
jgi:hypothetical protein|tara:strand:+ start:19076 stop:19201 length:126 start_codon:yes stop_codon:yes gene_type:complete